MDAGEPCSQRLCELGISTREIDAILISHGHSDHIGGLPLLMQLAWLTPRSKPLPVFMPAELIEPLRVWLNAVYLPDHLLGFPVQYHSWSAGEEQEIAPGVNVTPFSSSHLYGLREIIDPLAKERFLAYGLEVRSGGHRVVFSADLGDPSDMESVLSEPCDVLVCELSHFAPEALFAFLSGRSIRTLVLNHLAGELKGREQELLAMARRALGEKVQVVIPSDGEEVPL